MAPHNPAMARIAVRNTLWFSIGSYLTQLIAFVATLILTRRLGPEIFGIFAIGSFWCSLLTLEPKFGVYYAGIQHSRLDGELLGTYYRLQLVLAAGSFIIGIVASIVLVAIGYAVTVGIVVVFLMSISSLNAIASPLGIALEKELQLSRTSLVAVVASLLAYGVALTMAYAGAGIWSLLAMSLVTTLSSMIGLYLVCRRRLPWVFKMRWQFNRELARQFLKLGVPIGLANVTTSSIVTQYDNFLIGTFVSTNMLGYYDRAYRLSQWPNTLLTAPVTRVALLTFAKVKDDLPRLTQAVRLTLWILTTLGPPIALFLFFGAHLIIEILLGPTWSQSAYFLQFLAVYSVFSPFSALAYSLGVAMGNKRFVITLTGSQAAMLVLAGTALTLWQGYTGTVAAVGIMNLVGFVIGCYYIFRTVQLPIRSIFGPAVLAIMIAVGLTFFVRGLPGWNSLSPILQLASIVMSAPGAYLVVVLALRPVETIERLRFLLRTFRKPGENAVKV